MTNEDEVHTLHRYVSVHRKSYKHQSYKIITECEL